MTGPEHLLASGAALPGGAVAQMVARRAAEDAERLAQQRRDRRNAGRRARRAKGSGTRAAGATAPTVDAPTAAATPLPHELDGLVWCGRCQRRVTPAVKALHDGDPRAATVEAFAGRRAELGIGGAGAFNPMTAQW